MASIVLSNKLGSVSAEESHGSIAIMTDAGFGQRITKDSPDVEWIESLIQMGLIDIAVDACRGRQRLSGASQPESFAGWTMLWMQSIAAKISIDPTILDEPKPISDRFLEIDELALRGQDMPRASWLSLKSVWCRWYVLRRTLAAYLAAPTRQELRERSLAIIRESIDKLEKLQLKIQKAPERGVKPPPKNSPTASQWIGLTNEVHLLQADLMLLRAMFYPAKSTERIGAATEMLTSLDKAAAQIGDDWTGRPNVELARCKAMLLLDRPNEAIVELAKLQVFLQRPQHSKLFPTSRWGVRIATLAAEAHRELGNLTESNRWLAGVGGWTQSPEIAIEHFSNMVAASSGKTVSPTQLSEAIRIKTEIGKRFGSYWQQRADAVLVSNKMFNSNLPSTHGAESINIRVELLMTEAKQSLAAKNWQEAIDKLKQAETSAANAEQLSLALDVAIRIASVYVNVDKHDLAQAEFHRAAMAYHNEPKAPNVALMSVWQFDTKDMPATVPEIERERRPAEYQKRLTDIVNTWPISPQAETACAKLDQFLLVNNQLSELALLWGNRLETIASQNRDGKNVRIPLDTFDRAFSRFGLLSILTQDSWLDRTKVSTDEDSEIQKSVSELKMSLSSTADTNWRALCESCMNRLQTASHWPEMNFWPMPFTMVEPNPPTSLTLISGIRAFDADTPIIRENRITELATSWVRTEFIFQQILRNGITGDRMDSNLLTLFSQSLDRMKSLEKSHSSDWTQVFSGKQAMYWKRSVLLYAASLQCWTGDEASGIAELEAAQKADARNPWWSYRMGRLFQTLGSQRELAIKHFRSLANGFASGSDAWLESRARTAETFRIQGKYQAAKELADLVFATYPSSQVEWQGRFTGQ